MFCLGTRLFTKTFSDCEKEVFSQQLHHVCRWDIVRDEYFPYSYHTEVLCNHFRDMTCISPCTHDEVDDHIVLHLEDVVERKDILTLTVDTEILVLAVTAAYNFIITELALEADTNRHILFCEIARCPGLERC